MSVITSENLMSTMTAAVAVATEEEIKAFSLALKERCGLTAAAPAAPKEAKEAKEAKEEKPKPAPKPRAPKKEKEAPEMPEMEDGSAPPASKYRVNPADVDHSVCVGRAKDDDKRWKPIIFRERQCGKKLAEGNDDLCKLCAEREEEYAKIADARIRHRDYETAGWNRAEFISPFSEGKAEAPAASPPKEISLDDFFGVGD